MNYEMLVVPDDAIPGGRDWLFIRHAGGDLLVVCRGALGSPELLLELWAGSLSEFDVRAAPLRAVV